MKRQTILSASFLFLLGASLFQMGCGRREEIADDNETARESAFADDAFNDSKSIADQAASGALTSFKTSEDAGIMTNCATITHDSLATPRTITIDFGSANCLCNDGRNRRGKIMVSYTGRYRDAGTVITITHDNFFVNDNQILGTKTVTNNGTNAQGNMTYSVSLANGQVILAGGGTISHSFDRTREWIAGANTPQWSDDEYLISGTASGTRANGDSWTSVINSSNPLHKIIGCKHFVSGSMDITPTGKPARTIDFGNGTCDDEATVSVNGRSRVITLR